MEPIIFNIGEENGIVVETSKFQYSLFKEQYKKAFELIKQIWKKQDDMREQKSYGMDNRFSNIISFCGDRGEGKSSCMSSFSLILSDEKVREAAKDNLQLKEDCQYSWEKVELIDTIDPAFFDKDHNILELLIGRMFNRVNEDIKRTDVHEERRYKSRKLIEQFSRVQKSMKVLKKPEEQYDSLENIASMSAGIELKAMLNLLFEQYLDFCGKKRIVLCVDDIDLNMTEGYSMAELIRKYLVNPYCIILLAVKIDQMVDVVAGSMAKELKDSGYSKEYCTPMAQKYVTKFLPHGYRVYMPASVELCERPIIIKLSSVDINEKDLKEDKQVPLKEYIVRLIYQKTGYVFYNTQNLSPIIPNNLRSLRHLIGTLQNIQIDAITYDENDNKIDCEEGREIFREYFFNTWASKLQNKDYAFAQSLLDYDDLPTLNKYVIEHFSNRIIEEKIIEQADIEDNSLNLYNKITQKNNVACNISLGDVMYVLWSVDKITMNMDIKNLIFLLKTFYSMRLYSCYNNISSSLDSLYPDSSKKEKEDVTIHKSDKMYKNVNQLQRLVNGSFFTYPQNTLLQPKGNINDRYARDLKIVSLAEIKNLFTQLLAQYKEMIAPEDSASMVIEGVSPEGTNTESILTVPKMISDEFTAKLQLCEYLALCLSRTISDLDKKDIINLNRQSLFPTYLGELSNSANYAIFDFLHPFYALCNIKYAYKRFDDILNSTKENNQEGDKTEYSFYDIALYDPKSMLSQMLNFVRADKDSKEWDKHHNLISDAVIRVIDIQWAIMDILTYSRDKNRSNSEDIYKITSAYDDIQKLNIKLYPRLNDLAQKEASEEEKKKGLGKLHIIKFEFLREIVKILKDLDNNVFEGIVIDYVQQKESVDRNQIVSLLGDYLDEIEYSTTGRKITEYLSKKSGLNGPKKGNYTRKLNDVLGRDVEYARKEDVISKMVENMSVLRDIMKRN